MLGKEKLRRDAVEITNANQLVPPDHLLRRIGAAVDCERIMIVWKTCIARIQDARALTRSFQHLYGIPSLLRMIKEIETSIAYRWFRRYTLNDHSSLFFIFGKRPALRFIRRMVL